MEFYYICVCTFQIQTAFSIPSTFLFNPAQSLFISLRLPSPDENHLDERMPTFCYKYSYNITMDDSDGLSHPDLLCKVMPPLMTNCTSSYKLSPSSGQEWRGVGDVWHSARVRFGSPAVSISIHWSDDTRVYRCSPNLQRSGHDKYGRQLMLPGAYVYFYPAYASHSFVYLSTRTTFIKLRPGRLATL